MSQLSRIAVFSSWGPGNFETVVKFCNQHTNIELSLLLSDNPDSPSVNLAKKYGIETFTHSIDSTYGNFNKENVDKRSQELLPFFNFLTEFEKNNGPIDLVVLAFRKILVGPLLHEYQNRMINVHPSDLSIHNVSDRKPRYVGINGLKNAILEGNKTTRTSIHRVVFEIDAGPLVCLGPAVEFLGDMSNDLDIENHEKAQKIRSDSPALLNALNQWHEGKFDLLNIL